MKQKIITADSTGDMEYQLINALAYGWLVQQVAGNGNGMWIAVLYRNDDETPLA